LSKLTLPEALFDNLTEFNQLNPQLENRVKKTALPSAYDDYMKAREFLKSYRGSAATFKSYRRELERFLHWSWQVAGKSICAIKRDDIEAFVHFCQNPPKSWIGFVQLARFVTKEGLRLPNPKWRPFVVSISKKARAEGAIPSKVAYALSQNGVQAIFSVLSSFYSFLIQEGHTEVNPVMNVRQKSQFIRKRQSKKTIRRLSETQWHYVITQTEKLADASPDKYERSLFIMSTLYGMYLRISELAASERWIPQMGDFYRDQHNSWWFKTVGKGNKERDIAVSDSMLQALKRYRVYLSLSPLPAPGEITPLVPRNNLKGPITDTRYLRRLVQECFDSAVTALREDDLLEESEQLKSATVHWLRHTGISDDVKLRPREHVRDDAGHSSGAITDRYIDVELQERHKSAKDKSI
jgi:site-specific recombinase XerD